MKIKFIFALFCYSKSEGDQKIALPNLNDLLVAFSFYAIARTTEVVKSRFSSEIVHCFLRAFDYRKNARESFWCAFL